MKKNLTTNNKLKSYAALAISMIATQAGKSQVIYTDVDPDEAVDIGDFVPFDLDNDANDDFLFVNISYSGINAMNISPYASNGVAGYMDTFFGSSILFAAMLNDGDAVDAGLDFYTGSTGPLLWGKIPVFGSFGAFNDVTNKYLGLKLKIGAETHYGWARLDVSHTTITLKDYAYEGTADAAINIIFDGIENAEGGFFPTVYTFEKGIFVELPADIADATASVFDITGKLIASQNINGTASIRMDAFPMGEYVIRISKEDKLFSTVFINQ